MAELANLMFLLPDAMSKGINFDMQARPETIKPANLSRYLLDEIADTKIDIRNLKAKLKKTPTDDELKIKLSKARFELADIRESRTVLNALRLPGPTNIPLESREYVLNRVQARLEVKPMLDDSDRSNPSPLRKKLSELFGVSPPRAYMGLEISS
ncbi:hypothetical protein CO168_02280 [Candidatus Shapirobacteria bacterium CG_4_9_14_3_um_filter_36_12]|uniref:Uncharacterized protein n=2 Tax=Candidatus Shapironibacteriota TaxID=1752721 RepID=A0A2M7XN10_9BACT|nr:MAG: hypothetical protein COS53_01030 [Candidatus Shapirobacteria bacterium CG03_land_8_20_14_0_80_35_14]PJA50968.1 MAG: hypothetical protein CO168_02280 [Candidatus Shapirobacteria bacterium CG_4_9_14_3_um_filter_36_12]